MTFASFASCTSLLAVIGCGGSSNPGHVNASTASAARPHEAVVNVGADFEVHGHRGARGSYPENTIEGLLAAYKDGATILETDLLLTKDGVLVLHHDVALNPDTTRDASGNWLPGTGPTILSIAAADLAAFDVGRLRPDSEYSNRFPRQQGQDSVRIPTLDDALVALDKATEKRVRWNLEIKIDTEHPERTAAPDAVVDATIAIVRARGLEDRIMIQSFDWRVIARVQQVAPKVPTGCLSAPDTKTGDVPNLVAAARCTYWTPKFEPLTADEVSRAHALGLKVVPWTVNEVADMRRMIDISVDGLITDYPDRIRRQPQ